MTVYVFLGPSLPREKATGLLDATYLPPIQQGDLVRLLEREPRYVGIIDGYFETVPAVWHKEILLALSRGVRVFGAASMGALRAAELHSFGMVGIGTIFTWYREGVIVADDEVAVQHAPGELGYLPLSRALVDIRHGCMRAVAERVIDPPLADRIFAAARELPYWERTCEAVAACLTDSTAVEHEAVARWRAFMETRCGSLKAQDAEELLIEMRAEIGRASAPLPSPFALEETVFLNRLLNSISVEKALQVGGQHPSTEIDLDLLRRNLLLKLTAREAATAAGWEVPAEALREEATQLCIRLGLSDAAELGDRLRAAGLGEAVLWAHLRDELFVRRLIRRWEYPIENALAQEIRLAGALSSRSK